MPASKPLEKLNIVAIADYRAENVSITVLIQHGKAAPADEFRQLLTAYAIKIHPIRTSDPSDQ